MNGQRQELPAQPFTKHALVYTDGSCMRPADKVMARAGYAAVQLGVGALLHSARAPQGDAVSSSCTWARRAVSAECADQGRVHRELRTVVQRQPIRKYL